MICDDAELLISDLIDDEIADADRDALMAHTAVCERCAATLKQMRRTVRFVRANSIELRPGTPGAQYMEFTRAMVAPDDPRDVVELAQDKGYLDKED